jgi:hypothetical protein
MLFDVKAIVCCLINGYWMLFDVTAIGCCLMQFDVKAIGCSLNNGYWILGVKAIECSLMKQLLDAV